MDKKPSPADAMRFPHRYTKEELLDIKERPPSKRRPSCLSEKYDSDGVWDPEKWHASLYPNSGRTSPAAEAAPKKDPDPERTSLARRLMDPRERVKEDDLEVVLSPQRRSFGGGCHVTAAASSGTRRAGSPLEKESDGARVLGGRRIGSGRIMAARGFEKERCGEKDARDPREREYKEKRFRRDFGDGKRVFGEQRRRHDPYAAPEEEPEWFSGGPTSQSETIELTGFFFDDDDDDVLRPEDPKGRKRGRRRTATAAVKGGVECNGGLPPEDEETQSGRETMVSSEQEAALPEAALPEASPGGEFDFNEFFNLDKSVPGLASMIEDVLGEGSVSASRFSRWFSNPSRSGSRSSSLRSTPHEELERLAGLDPGANSGNFFAPIPSSSLEEDNGPEVKVDILEMLQRAKVDLRPLLSSLSANQERLRQSTHSGVVLSVEEVEAGLKGLKMEPEGRDPRRLRDGGGGNGDMSAFNKLVSSMKASGTLPSQGKTGPNPDRPSLSPPEAAAAQKNILQEILGPPPPPSVLNAFLAQRPPPPTPTPSFPARAASADYLRRQRRVPSPVGFGPGSHPLLGDPFQGMRKSLSPAMAAATAQVSAPVSAPPEAFPGNAGHDFGRAPDKNREAHFRHRRKSPAGNAASPPSVTSMLSPSFTPTSVIRKMYEGKDKTKDENGGGGKTKNGRERDNHEETAPPSSSSSAAASKASSSSALRSPKDHDFRPKPCGRRTPSLASPLPTPPPFLRGPSLAPAPAPPMAPMMPPPGLVQRMLAQGLAAGPFLGPPLYPALPAAGHPLFHPRLTAVHRNGNQASSASGISPNRGGGGSPPVGLAKWFGSDVLQQPLPSMPAKVIRVDELEFRQ